MKTCDIIGDIKFQDQVKKSHHEICISQISQSTQIIIKVQRAISRHQLKPVRAFQTILSSQTNLEELQQQHKKKIKHQTGVATFKTALNNNFTIRDLRYLVLLPNFVNQPNKTNAKILIWT